MFQLFDSELLALDDRVNEISDRNDSNQGSVFQIGKCLIFLFVIMAMHSSIDCSGSA